MSISGYIGEIYFPGVKNVLNYDICDLNFEVHLTSVSKTLMKPLGFINSYFLNIQSIQVSMCPKCLSIQSVQVFKVS